MTTTADAVLGDLSAQRATGALVGAGGTLYLVDGDVTYAESPRAPGIESLLTAPGRVPRQAWQRALDRAGTCRSVGACLVESGSIARGELEVWCTRALFDAAYFALDPEGGPGRFRRGAQHWFGAVRPVAAAAVSQENRRRRRLLAALWPCSRIDTEPVVRLGGRPGRVSRGQRRVLEVADGRRTPADIARLLGRPAFHTLVDVRRLAAAGQIRSPLPGSHTPRARAPDWVSQLSAGSEANDIALLRRIRDALEARL